MIILVTGGAGFIGSHVVDRLLKAGHKVIVIDDLSTGSEKNLNKNAVFYKIDISDNGEVEKIFCDNRIDAVFHFAAQIDVRISAEKPNRDAEINIVGTLNILKSMKEHNARKIIFSSSGGAVYGEVESPADEIRPVSPISPYGISKYTCEMYIKFFAREYGIDYTILRYANVFGPRQSNKGEAGVVAVFIRNMIEGKECYLYGHGEMYRDYVYVGDVAEANLFSLENAAGLTLNIGTSRAISVKEVFAEIQKMFPSYEMTPVFAEKRLGEIVKSIVDGSLYLRTAKKENYLEFEKGIEKTVKWFKEIKNG